MSEARQYPRHNCRISVNFQYQEGDPDSAEIENCAKLKGKGTIMDWSRGGVLIVSKSRVSVGGPIELQFKVKRKKNLLAGTIVRTGLIANNPSEVAQRIKDEKVKGDAYIGVKFKDLIDELDV